MQDLTGHAELGKLGLGFVHLGVVAGLIQTAFAEQFFHNVLLDGIGQTVTGDVTLKLYKGNMILAGVTSPFSLYDPEIATFEEDDVYNQADATGFINLFGLPIKVNAKMRQKNNIEL